MDNETSNALYIPLLLGLFAFLVSQGYQTVQLISGHSALTAERQAQDESIKKSDQMRQQFSTLANKTNDLAKNGDAEAKAIVDAFAKQGITFKTAPEGKPAS